MLEQQDVQQRQTFASWYNHRTNVQLVEWGTSSHRCATGVEDSMLQCDDESTQKEDEKSVNSGEKEEDFI